MIVLDEEAVLVFEGLEEAECVNRDGPAEFHLSMRCCRVACLSCARCLQRKRDQLAATGVRMMLCRYCAHVFGLVGDYDAIVKAVPV